MTNLDRWFLTLVQFDNMTNGDIMWSVTQLGNTISVQVWMIMGTYIGKGDFEWAADTGNLISQWWEDNKK
jgi:hypothetical protein